jgi:CheY-like chemotaxis protein
MAQQPNLILIVEDEKQIRDILVEALATGGFPAEGAANGREALDRLRAGFRPSLILLDMMMPVMDGYGFLCELAADQALRDIPVVVISASADLAALPGIAGYLPKPLHLDELFAMVSRVCTRADAQPV